MSSESLNYDVDFQELVDGNIIRHEENGDDRHDPKNKDQLEATQVDVNLFSRHVASTSDIVEVDNAGLATAYNMQNFTRIIPVPQESATGGKRKFKQLSRIFTCDTDSEYQIDINGLFYELKNSQDEILKTVNILEELAKLNLAPIFHLQLNGGSTANMRFVLINPKSDSANPNPTRVIFTVINSDVSSPNPNKPLGANNGSTFKLKGFKVVDNTAEGFQDNVLTLEEVK